MPITQQPLKRHYGNTCKDFTCNKLPYKSNKCGITCNGVYLLLILLINYFTYSSKKVYKHLQVEELERKYCC